MPVLGICFGAQALCVAFGGKVDELPAKEVGWKVIDSVTQNWFRPDLGSISTATTACRPPRRRSWRPATNVSRPL